jgi:hypothetical protein
MAGTATVMDTATATDMAGDTGTATATDMAGDTGTAEDMAMAMDTVMVMVTDTDTDTDIESAASTRRRRLRRSQHPAAFFFVLLALRPLTSDFPPCAAQYSQPLPWPTSCL